MKEITEGEDFIYITKKGRRYKGNIKYYYPSTHILRLSKLIILSVLLLLLSSYSLQAATTGTLPGDLTIAHNSFKEYVSFPGDVNLQLRYSSLPTTYLTIETNGYNPLDNETQYSFQSIEYTPEYWEHHLDLEYYIFQDTISKHLYIIKINMTNIQLPDNPWKTCYHELEIDYNSTLINFTQTLDNLTIQELILHDIRENYNYTLNQMTLMISDNQNLTNNLVQLSIELDEAEEQVNNSKNALLEAMTNLTSYRKFYDQMNGYQGEFFFKIGGDEKQFTTINEYENQITDLQNEIRSYPLLIVFAIVITIFTCLLLAYKKWGTKKPTPTYEELNHGITPEATKANNFYSTLAKKPDNIKTTTSEKNKNIPQTDNYGSLKKEVDTRITNMENKIDLNHREIVKQLEKALASKTPVAVKT